MIERKRFGSNDLVISDDYGFIQKSIRSFFSSSVGYGKGDTVEESLTELFYNLRTATEFVEEALKDTRSVK